MAAANVGRGRHRGGATARIHARCARLHAACVAGARVGVGAGRARCRARVHAARADRSRRIGEPADPHRLERRAQRGARGRPRQVRLSAAPVRDGNGRVPGEPRLDVDDPRRFVEQHHRARHDFGAVAAMAAVRFRRPRGARRSGRTGIDRVERRVHGRAPAGDPRRDRLVLPLRSRPRARAERATGPRERGRDPRGVPRAAQARRRHGRRARAGDAEPRAGEPRARAGERRRERRLPRARLRARHLAAVEADDRRAAEAAAAARARLVGRRDRVGRDRTPARPAGRVRGRKGQSREDQGRGSRVHAEDLPVRVDVVCERRHGHLRAARDRRPGADRQPERQPLRRRRVPRRDDSAVRRRLALGRADAGAQRRAKRVRAPHADQGGSGAPGRRRAERGADEPGVARRREGARRCRANQLRRGADRVPERRRLGHRRDDRAKPVARRAQRGSRQLCRRIVGRRRARARDGHDRRGAVAPPPGG
ncbi:hypothetical protein F01_460336 [Burkholderia cenocepacia]|nr:hypothetical protein F01_460336 [Burkholderia cenocepacia]